MLRLLLSIIAGWLLGRERKYHHKDGGSRTMAMICFSACLIAIISKEIQLLGYNFDFTRMMAYVLPAIGFIGMGIIRKHEENVDGLTTSATLIMLLPIGFCFGLGFYFYGLLSSLLAFLILESKYYFKQGE